MNNKSGVFNAYSKYYDLLYRDKDYAAEVDYIDTLLQRNKLGGRDLLEFGSGTGKHGGLLAERGYRVHGIERSAEMVARAATSKGFTCEVGDICSTRLSRPFDAVVSLFHVVSYQISNADVQAVFGRAADHLTPKGLFVFDIWYSPAVYAQKPEVRIKRMADEALEITRIAEPVIYPNENRVDVNYTIIAMDLITGGVQTLKEIHAMRHFSLPELNLLAQANGFEWVLAEEYLTGREPNEETWGVCIVLRKV